MSDSLKSPRDRAGHSTFLAFIGVFCALVAIGVAREEFQVRPGLHVRHFASLDGTGDPAHTGIDDEISTASVTRGWNFLPPDEFSARWSGYLFVERPGAYRFATTSDDGAALYVDGRLVVDNWNARGLSTATGTVTLESGSHQVALNYVNAGGGYQMGWAWARENESPVPVPGWLLSAKPLGVPALLAVRILDWLWPFSGALLLLLAGRLIALRGWWPKRMDDAPATLKGSRHTYRAFPLATRSAVIALAFFLAAAIAQTWPLATNPAHLSRNDNADTILNEWTIAWVAHELPRAPLHLFDANIFHPDKNSLAYSENLVVQGVMGAPLLWLGASPVLAYNLLLLAGFTLTGWATCLVVARWTEDWFAGTAAGLMVAFNAHTLTRLPHLQAQHAEFLPLALLAFDQLLARPRWRTAAWLTIAFVLQALASIYLLVFTTIALGVALLARPEDWSSRRRALDLAPKLVLAAVVATAALLPFLLPYWHLRASGVSRSIDEAAFFAATTKDYLTTPGRFHTWTGGGSALFPGFAALALAGIAVATGKAFRDPRARMCLAFGICGVVLSFGPAVAPGYEFLFTKLPLLEGIRTSSRFGYLGIVALAILGGYGAAILRQSLAANRPALHAASAVVLALVFLDPLAAPIGYEPFDAVPAIYALPASDANAVVVELPLAPPERQYRDAPALLHSTANWRPLVNGYSGFTPPGYVRKFETMNHFPARDALAALRADGVTDVFVHTDQFAPETVDAIGREPSLRRVAADGSVVLYTLGAAVDYR